MVLHVWIKKLLYYPVKLNSSLLLFITSNASEFTVFNSMNVFLNLATYIPHMMQGGKSWTSV